MRLEQIPNFYELMEGYIKIKDRMHINYYNKEGEVVGSVLHGFTHDSYWVKDYSHNIETISFVSQLLK